MGLPARRAPRLSKRARQANLNFPLALYKRESTLLATEQALMSQMAAGAISLKSG